jgi:hypothetical protein
MNTLSFAALATVCAIASAQRMLVVDAAGGPGSQFTRIQPAIQAAVAGDTVLVRAGTYAEALDVDKGIALIGQEARLQLANFSLVGLVIHDLPASDWFVMRGFRTVQGLGRVFPIRVTACEGPVTVRDLRRNDLAIWSLRVTDSLQVHVADLLLYGAAFERSSVVVERAVVEPDIFHAVQVVGGEVRLVQCSMRGGLGLAQGAGVFLDAGRVLLTRSMAAGTGAGSSAHSAIETVAGEVILDPTTTLSAPAGVPLISGPATVTTLELASLAADSTGSQLDVALHGPAGAGFVTLLSFPGPILPTPFGELWVHYEANLLLDYGVLPADRSHRTTLVHGPVPPGVALTLQSVLFQQDFLLSTPTRLVFP